MTENVIKTGDWAIVQRQKYTKLHKIKENSKINLGANSINLDNAIGHKYQDIFQMVMQNSNKRLYGIEKVEEINKITEINIEKSGKDNRNIYDDGSSQNLTKDEIEKLKEENSSASDVVEKLINNSKTFNMKTEYAQQKYMKKKEKKYFEYITLRKPTIRLLAQMFYRQDPNKTLGMHIDDLSQVLTYANMQFGGNFLLYDSGTNGLMPAAILNLLGDDGYLIHMHPGNECQKTGLLAMGFPKEKLERCINVNSYSVLRCFYQNSNENVEIKKENIENANQKTENVNQKIETNTSENNQNISQNNEKMATETIEKNSETSQDSKEDGTVEISNKRKFIDDTSLISKRLKLEDHEYARNRPIWQIENERACKILQDKVEGLILTIKEHPIKLVAELINFLNGGRQLVVYSLIREPLFELYNYLKSRCDVINIKVSNNFMRHYQILPDRTHPEVTMTSGGFILSAIKLCD